MGVPGRIHSIESFGALDGPGIRYVLFLQGCSLRCLYCHNPDTWDPADGKPADSDEIMKDILSYRSFIRSGGVTLSGGEPLLQPEFAREILLRCREAGIHTAIDTAGSVPLSVSAPVIDAADLLLLDIKSFDDALCRELTGRSNENTLRTLEYCEKTRKPVWLRHVLVPGWTLKRELLEPLADYLSRFPCVELVELLPFHKMGEYKWRELKLPYRLTDTPVPAHEELEAAKAIFTGRGLKCLMKE
ncbi:MAG: pyruvate formate lyase-activating protein [Clostridiales bacterium]|nr:pyruvate formate lyase-activating protein [Clostridiales bacterium]